MKFIFVAEKSLLLLCKNVKDILILEEMLAIDDYCSENKIPHKARLEELGIHFWDFYKTKKSIEKTHLRKRRVSLSN